MSDYSFIFFIGFFLGLFGTVLLNLSLGFYLISTLQWYSYKLERVCFHFSKPLWHFCYFILPTLAFVFAPLMLFIPLFIIYLIFLFLWQRKLDKKLVFTRKVKVFFILLGVFSVLFYALKFFILPPFSLAQLHLIKLNEDFIYLLQVLSSLFLLLPLVLALIFLKIFSLLEERFYIKKAREKLAQMKDLKIILITASFGKTSIKNFLYELLSPDFRVHKSARSINTLLGIVADINSNLNENTQIYIAEAGARKKGDILELTELLNPQIVIIGEIGSAHLEYFKSEENIRKTKLEALNSKCLQKAYLHSSTQIAENNQFIIYDKRLKNVRASLDGLDFEVLLNEKWQEFKSRLLGSFNAQNITVSLLCASDLGAKDLKERVLNLKSVEHRLQIISKSPKFIIDDGFNGNFKGMSASYELCKTYTGRCVVITPGIVEVNKEQNIALAKIIDECFDLAIITGALNAEIFEENLTIEKIILENKADLVKVLAAHTKNGDLILFSNDAPNFM